MESIFDQIKDRVSVSDVVERFGGVKLDRNKKGLCPFHNEKTPSFSVTEDDKAWTCFGCGAHGDAVDFVAKIRGIESLDAAHLIADAYGIQYEAPQPKSKSVLMSDYIKQCIKDIGKTDYFEKRGLTADTIKKFCLGYDTYRQAVVIPYSSKLEYYQTRSIIDKKFYKPKVEDAGAEPIYNASRLEKLTQPVFVVESPICAMSIEQCGGSAIALCGVGNTRKLMSLLDKKYKGILILALDNDDAGRKATTELASYLFENNIKYKAVNVAKDLKDPNELLMRSPKELKESVASAIWNTRLAFSSISHVINCAELQEKDLPPIQWIVQDLLPEGLAMLCAPSKYGKSFMMMQLATDIVEGKPFLDCRTQECGVAYFSLEDSDRRLQTRLNEMMKQEKVSGKFNAFLTAKTMDDGLFTQFKEVLEFFPKTKLIIVDTFQKVRGKVNKAETAYGSDYREMSDFKEFADKNHICILLVHHLRKQADDTDIYNRISGSMGLMGAADTIWILSRKKRTDTCTSFMATGRDVENIELALEFSPITKCWTLLGTQDDQSAKKAQQDYENDPVIKTIKALVKKKNSWSGKASDLKTMVYDKTGRFCDLSPEAIGKLITKYQDRLYGDKITHTVARGKVHTFAIRQYSMFDSSDD